jgi:hypothetical protein
MTGKENVMPVSFYPRESTYFPRLQLRNVGAVNQTAVTVSRFAGVLNCLLVRQLPYNSRVAPDRRTRSNARSAADP